MIWKKPDGMRYTEMCMYIDANVDKIAEPGKYPEVENTIYNYLWLVVKALAIKKRMFSNFNEYDAYAFYAARRLYFALRKNIWNQGKVIRGKTIKPIKSCLNYTKSILHAMKIDYQNETYKQIVSSDTTKRKFDAWMCQNELRRQVRDSQAITSKYWFYLKDSLETAPAIIDRVLKNSSLGIDCDNAKNVKISLLISLISLIDTTNKLDANKAVIKLWHLPKTVEAYVKKLLIMVCDEIRNEVIECNRLTELDDITTDTIISNIVREELAYD